MFLPTHLVKQEGSNSSRLKIPDDLAQTNMISEMTFGGIRRSRGRPKAEAERKPMNSARAGRSEMLVDSHYSQLSDMVEFDRKSGLTAGALAQRREMKGS